ncbi:unnamed protein product [Durusdinium trenchii]|uniref:Prolyl 4-hydroxylase alpha subunit domain-containing protein n=1 Tax=Durusdinium trenchii TaxID=1381693 RepID=A0ABP0M1D8_9DINO
MGGPAPNDHASRCDGSCRDQHGLNEAAALRGHRGVLEAFSTWGATGAADSEERRTPSTSTAATEASCALTVIPRQCEHPGAGTTVVDDAVAEEILERLDELWRRLPLAPKEKASPTDRCYFDDVSGWLTGALDRAISVAALPDASSAVSRVRFLIYPEPGGCLPAHVDLPRTDKKGLRTTYTFLLYLSDCSSGGETTFLEALESDRELAASGGVMPGERRTLARVSPRRNRLLLMPHACPHLAAPIIHAPKVLVRGEVLPPTCMPHSSAVTVAPEPVQQDASSQLVELGDGVHSCWLDEKIDFERRTNVRCVWFSAHIG